LKERIVQITHLRSYGGNLSERSSQLRKLGDPLTNRGYLRIRYAERALEIDVPPNHHELRISLPTKHFYATAVSELNLAGMTSKVSFVSSHNACPVEQEEPDLFLCQLLSKKGNVG